MENKKILIVEDEKNIAITMAYNMKKNGYDCDVAYDGEMGLRLALENSYDLILLDIMLPKMDGFEVCERIRYKSEVPIIFVTAREDEKDKVLGLETGADDYVTKPFSLNELLARIKVNIRRSARENSSENANETEVKNPREESSIIRIGELEIDPGHYSVKKNGEDIELTKKDYDFLIFLARELGKAYSREELLEKIWGYDDYYGDIRNVDVTVSRIRKKIEDDPAKPCYLMTRRGVGYYLSDKTNQ